MNPALGFRTEVSQFIKICSAQKVFHPLVPSGNFKSFRGVTTPENKEIEPELLSAIEGPDSHFVPLKKEINIREGLECSRICQQEKNYSFIIDQFKWGGFDQNELFVTDIFYPPSMPM